MEFWLVIGGIWLIVWIVRRAFGSSGAPVTNSAPRYQASGRHQRKDTYRPRPPDRRTTRIVFNKPDSQQAGPTPTAEALEGLHDAFTGAPLNVGLGLYQCTKCKVYYHSASMEVLREENASRCVACGTGNLSALTRAQAKTSRGRDYRPDVVTLANYRSHFDRVVTFEGKVRDVKISRRGLDYAVMFDDASWTKGLKLVFFRGAVREIGGPDFITGLKGQSVRVRGLLVNHHRFGPEIIISERGMILEVSS